MAYDLLFKNTKRNWARVGDDPDGVMSPTFLSKKPTKPTRQTRKLDPDAPMPPTFLSKKPIKPTRQTRMLDDPDAVMAPTFDGEDDPLGDSCGSLNDDEATVALEGGSSEREALLRMRGWNPFKKALKGLSDQGVTLLGSSLSHAEYRALVLTEAMKSARDKKPSTKNFVEAKRKVDLALGRNKTRIKIPGARPGRRTI